MLLGVLLALSLVTVLAVAVSSHLQSRALQRTARTHPANGDTFDAIVAGLLAEEPTLGHGPA